jgi:hypothetical protein
MDLQAALCGRGVMDLVGVVIMLGVDRESGTDATGGAPGAQERAVTFVLFFLPRTGSNMLKEWLTTHPAVRCLPTIFGTGKGWPKPDPGGRGVMRWMRDNIASEWDDAELRRAKPRKLLRQILAASPDKYAIGFKYNLTPEPLTDEFLAFGAGLRKILLVRSNLLAAYSSDKVADATDQGTARKGAAVKRVAVEFDPAEFGRFVAKRMQVYSHARQHMRRPFLEIEYTVARTPEGIAKIGDFLNVDPSGFGAQTTVKRNSDDILSRFSNPELVQSSLNEKGLEHWATES